MEILTLKRKDYKDVMRLEAAYLDCPWSKKKHTCSYRRRKVRYAQGRGKR